MAMLNQLALMRQMFVTSALLLFFACSIPSIHPLSASAVYVSGAGYTVDAPLHASAVDVSSSVRVQGVDLLAEIRAMRELIRAQDETIQTLTNQLRTLNGTATAHAAQLMALQSSNATMAAKLLSDAASIDALTSQLRSINGTATMHAAQIMALQSANATVAAKLRSDATMIDALTARISNAENLIGGTVLATVVANHTVNIGLALQSVNRTVVAGSITAHGSVAVPSGWLPCNGLAISRVTFARLFAAIGTTWGAGDGSTTFHLPDLRGRVPVGAGTGSGSLSARSLADVGGAETHTLAATEMPSHTHAHTYRSPYQPGNSPVYGYSGNGYSAFIATAQAIIDDGSSNPLANNGGGLAHNNMQPFAVVQWIIKTGD